jgi:hypothetical protein
MLIRVVRAVNDFILSASFSDKGLREGVSRGLPGHFFVAIGVSGKDRALSIVSSASGPVSERRLRSGWLSLLLFHGFCFNCLF